MPLFFTTRKFVAVVQYAPDIVYCYMYSRAFPFCYRRLHSDIWSTDDFGYMYRYFSGVGQPFKEAVASVVSPLAGEHCPRIHVIFRRPNKQTPGSFQEF